MTGAAAQSVHSPPHVVIVGGGFAGLYAARALRRAPVRVTLVDRTNHHLFQPLLYQVATAALSPAEIAAPIRHVLARQRNTEVILAEVTAIKLARRMVQLRDGELSYDYLIVAAGAENWYFGKDDWSRFAPGLKTIPDALEIRERFLLAFERAERETDPQRRREELTFVVIGGGPTGVELAGAMAEIARRAIPRDFRRIDTTTARIILIEAADRILPAFPPELSRKAREDLEHLGVDVWLNTRVTGIDGSGVTLGGDRIATRNVFWGAGVRASPLAASLGVELTRDGRVPVQPDLSVTGHPEVFVVGDMARIADKKTGKDVPGVAPAAMQMGRHAAAVIAREAKGLTRARTPFIYKDKGNLATIGRAKAVGLIGRVQLRGSIAWWGWLLIHIVYLIGYRSRAIVLIQWAWAWFTFERGARLITNPLMRSKGADAGQSPGSAASPTASEPPPTKSEVSARTEPQSRSPDRSPAPSSHG